ncbi:hypothetical protein O1611_g8025 [Lasiodiplodia mahajangana]|uniref:Uncharacterized protein n=1 Tax=Lasiodiplodia mahajangana TaxID=1108764 RepID=A0ACC2JDZ1_9PEZI|nr:hypothetical protein O1611_g8025 [Lasiodiplodia mahajangana]
MRTPLPTRRPTPQGECVGAGNISRAMELVPKRTPLPTKRLVTLGNEHEAEKVVTKRTPLPTKRSANVGNDNDENKDGGAKDMVAKRTPLPTKRPAMLGDNGNKATQTNGAVAKGALPPTKRPRLVFTDDDNEVDLNTIPELKSANGVVLKTGRYRCNICGNQMKNARHIISSHNAKLHPKDPSKGSAYLRQIARNPTPCEECGKICSSIEMMKQHTKYAHKRAKQTTASTPPVSAS